MTASPLNEQGLPHGYMFKPDWEVTPRQVKAMLDEGADFVLIDCRTPREYQVARIVEAQLVPLQELGQRLEDLDELKDRRVVVHCHHGMRSLQMTAVLRQRGFDSVFSMAGGIDLWSCDVDPKVPRY